MKDSGSEDQEIESREGPRGSEKPERGYRKQTDEVITPVNIGDCRSELVILGQKRSEGNVETRTAMCY
ncbi:hypothetical protein Y1Q_0011333 [Alligator mississippiensis]|uniref:Uncharacterized protein n=1 Tax=Alligator mississippiensis TaxID=8496 RepID=A0A151N879_ALLMI|nr:hypothetical protein Y1Q_0011333 [Alligator mississippiensis]